VGQEIPVAHPVAKVPSAQKHCESPANIPDP
jgi:hypothetical protein